MRRATLRLRTFVGLAVLGLLGAHIASGHGLHVPLSGQSAPSEAPSSAAVDAPAASLVRALERREERARAERYAAWTDLERPIALHAGVIEGRASGTHEAAETEPATPTLPARPTLEGPMREWASVNASALNLRSGAGVSADRIGSYPADTRLLVLARSGNWTQVEHPETGQVGWMSSRFLDVAAEREEAQPRRLEAAKSPPAPQPPIAGLSPQPRRIDTPWRDLRETVESRAGEGDVALVTGARVNLRSGAGTAHDAITSYAAGTQLVILDRSGNWTRVEHTETGEVGWMASRFLDTSSRTAEAPEGERARL